MEENIHLEIAQSLLDERELATNLSRAIYNSLDALSAQLNQMIQREINQADYYDGELRGILGYCQERMNQLKVLAGVYNFNPKGCTGEQTYNFIQEFTQISSLDTKFGDLANSIHINNYSQADYNNLSH